eukprot:Gb_00537 [translate_table: standard]
MSAEAYEDVDPTNLRDKDGIMRCENNQRLWVWRKAGVRSIKVKVKSNDFLPRRQNNEDIANMIDPNAFSNIRGVSGNDRCNLEDPNVIRPITTQATGSASKTGNSGAEETPNPERGENETPFADILASAFVSVVMGVGFKLFRRGGGGGRVNGHGGRATGRATLGRGREGSAGRGGLGGRGRGERQTEEGSIGQGKASGGGQCRTGEGRGNK